MIEDEDEEKRRLLALSKAELIEHLMRAKVSYGFQLGGGID